MIMTAWKTIEGAEPELLGGCSFALYSPTSHPGEMFVADDAEVVITGLNAEATMLVVESWTAGRGLQRIERA